MIKPADIQSKQFEIKMRGYDRDQVDDFLDELIRDVATMYRDNAELTEKLEKAERELARMKERSEEVEKSIELARYQCEEMKKMASDEANRIIKEARERISLEFAATEGTKQKLKVLCTEFLENISND